MGVCMCVCCVCLLCVLHVCVGCGCVGVHVGTCIYAGVCILHIEKRNPPLFPNQVVLIYMTVM